MTVDRTCSGPLPAVPKVLEFAGLAVLTAFVSLLVIGELKGNPYSPIPVVARILAGFACVWIAGMRRDIPGRSRISAALAYLIGELLGIAGVFIVAAVTGPKKKKGKTPASPDPVPAAPGSAGNPRLFRALLASVAFPESCSRAEAARITNSRLRQYRQLFDDGLISDGEFGDLRDAEIRVWAATERQRTANAGCSAGALR